MHLFDIISPDGAPKLLASLPNDDKPGSYKLQRYVKSAEELDHFLKKYDHAGRALYFTVAELNDGARRLKEEVVRTYYVWTEIDFKDHPDLAHDEIRQRVDSTPFPPTLIILSGHSLHLYWRLKEAL